VCILPSLMRRPRGFEKGGGYLSSAQRRAPKLSSSY
jgi:hypothetical protein